MVDGVLEIAAYCSLGMAMGLLLVRLFWPKVAPRFEVRRFRRRLDRAEGVVAGWAEELGRGGGRRHEQRHPEPTDD